MNYFFSISNKFLKTKLTIPQFRNDGFCDESYVPFKATIKDKKWEIEVAKFEYNNHFFIIDDKELKNDCIFFLNKNFNKNRILENRLVKYNSYTDTIPEFRANLKIKLRNGGFSSYQSEYPYQMATKLGSIVSPLSALTNVNSEQNFLFIKNIFYKPIKETFNLYFIDIKNEKIVYKTECLTNYTNEIVVKNSFIKPNIYIYTQKYICIPMFVSISDKQVSFEHTHPPQLYLLSKEKFKIISKIKNKINEIINS